MANDETSTPESDGVPFDTDRFQAIVPDIDPVNIPAELVEKWFEIDGKEMLNVVLPRAAFDALFTAIDNCYVSSTASQRGAALMIGGDVEGSHKELAAAALATRKGVNALRHWTIFVMATATGELDHLLSSEDGNNEK